jgi:hypothetical protein
VTTDRLINSLSLIRNESEMKVDLALILFIYYGIFNLFTNSKLVSKRTTYQYEILVRNIHLPYNLKCIISRSSILFYIVNIDESINDDDCLVSTCSLSLEQAAYTNWNKTKIMNVIMVKLIHLLDHFQLDEYRSLTLDSAKQ